jgi:hypothetical protein
MSKEERARAKLAADPLPASPYLQVGADQILIKCGFSEQLLQLLRWVPKFEWHPELRGWTLPITGAETLRSVLPEVLRLAEATEEMHARQLTANEPDATLSAEELFKASARLLFGSDWQRETARALGRDETTLARFLLGERTLEDGEQLYADMLALMQRRAGEIAAAADRFALTLASEQEGEHAASQKSPASDQGI